MTIGDYLALPYRIELIPCEESGYVSRLPDLPGCRSQGDLASHAASGGTALAAAGVLSCRAVRRTSHPGT